MKKYKNWKYIEKIIIIVQFIIIIFGCVYSYDQNQDIKNNKLNRQNDLGIRYYDRLNTGINRKIFIAIQNKKPLLLANGGNFTKDQFDDYLGDLHDTGQSLGSDLINGDIACSSFSDITDKTWNNSEIQDYLKETRKEDPKYFSGFDELYNFTKTCE